MDASLAPAFVTPTCRGLDEPIFVMPGLGCFSPARHDFHDPYAECTVAESLQSRSTSAGSSPPGSPPIRKTVDNPTGSMQAGSAMQTCVREPTALSIDKLLPEKPNRQRISLEGILQQDRSVKSTTVNPSTAMSSPSAAGMSIRAPPGLEDDVEACQRMVQQIVQGKSPGAQSPSAAAAAARAAMASTAVAQPTPQQAYSRAEQSHHAPHLRVQSSSTAAAVAGAAMPKASAAPAASPALPQAFGPAKQGLKSPHGSRVSFKELETMINAEDEMSMAMASSFQPTSPQRSGANFKERETTGNVNDEMLLAMLMGSYPTSPQRSHKNFKERDTIRNANDGTSMATATGFQPTSPQRSRVNFKERETRGNASTEMLMAMVRGFRPTSPRRSHTNFKEHNAMGNANNEMSKAMATGFQPTSPQRSHVSFKEHETTSNISNEMSMAMSMGFQGCTSPQHLRTNFKEHHTMGNTTDEMSMAMATSFHTNVGDDFHIEPGHMPVPQWEFPMPSSPPSKKTRTPQVLCLADVLTEPEANDWPTTGKTTLPLADMLPAGPAPQASQPGPSPSRSSVRLNLELLTCGSEVHNSGSGKPSEFSHSTGYDNAPESIEKKRCQKDDSKAANAMIKGLIKYIKNLKILQSAHSSLDVYNNLPSYLQKIMKSEDYNQQIVEEEIARTILLLESIMEDKVSQHESQQNIYSPVCESTSNCPDYMETGKVEFIRLKL